MWDEWHVRNRQRSRAKSDTRGSEEEAWEEVGKGHALSDRTSSATPLSRHSRCMLTAANAATMKSRTEVDLPEEMTVNDRYMTCT